MMSDGDARPELAPQHDVLAKDYPLRAEMLDKAPGTSNHVGRVADLAEAAATALKRDVGIVRAMRMAALLHDCGKLVKPVYYGENLSKDDYNIHDDISPELSAQIMFAHVGHTARILTADPNVPREVINWCIEHHGTCVAKHPYARAVAEAEAAGKDAPDKDLYRYPGPKPSSLESAVLMLCDHTEAITRSKHNARTLDSCEQVVRATYDELEADGQFNHVQVYVWELRALKEVLARELEASYHGRPVYAEAPEVAEAAPSAAAETG